jgi:uncharacterized protein YifE (UPF0438 family)
MNEQKTDKVKLAERQFVYLMDALERLGFENKMDIAIFENLKQDPDKFVSSTALEFDHKKINYTILFKKYERPNMYFPTAYRAELDHDKSKNRIFSLNDNIEIKAQEAFNLLEGRSVNRVSLENGALSQKWLTLDFNDKDQHGNPRMQVYQLANNDYLLSRALARYPLKECNVVEDKVDLIISLNKGNREPVTLRKDNKEEKLFVEACPRERDVNFYNDRMMKLDRKDLIRKHKFPDVRANPYQRKGRLI